MSSPIGSVFPVFDFVMYKKTFIVGMSYTGVGEYQGNHYQNLTIFSLAPLRVKSGSSGGFNVGQAGSACKIKILNNPHFTGNVGDLQKYTEGNFEPFVAEIGYIEVADTSRDSESGATIWQAVDFRLIKDVAKKG